MRLVLHTEIQHVNFKRLFYLLSKNSLSYFNDTDCRLRTLSIASRLFLMPVVFTDSEEDVEPIEIGQ